jgi:hypothetical protein
MNTVAAARVPPIDVSIVISSCDGESLSARTADSIANSRTSLRYESLLASDHGKNAAATRARGRYLCFIDDGILTNDGWLDLLRETCDRFLDGALISGSLIDALNTASGANQADPIGLPPPHHASYTLTDLTLGTSWFRYSRPFSSAYAQPLCPGGLMFTQKRYFAKLGGFSSRLRKAGMEDVQLSLHNYFAGGENIVDPRVTAYRLCKTHSHSICEADPVAWAYNSLYLAGVYLPPDIYASVRESVLRTVSAAASTMSEVEPLAATGRLDVARLPRSFEHWNERFGLELGGFMHAARAAHAGTSASSRAR